jgi:hypothetical protein
VHVIPVAHNYAEAFNMYRKYFVTFLQIHHTRSAHAPSGKAADAGSASGYNKLGVSFVPAIIANALTAHQALFTATGM